MSNKITEAFAKGKAFIPFITCGDPSLEITEQLVYAMEEAGADLIELGIPFSDPTAEGPVIQEANVRALSGGVTTDKVFDMVAKIRQKTAIPMVHDLCQCCFFLWNRALHKESSRSGNGWTDPSRCTF